MIKNENDILKYIISNIKTKSKNVLRSIGDDCAVIKVNGGDTLVITTDTSLLGPHFTSDYTAYEIGYKCLATNLSDIAAMGCKPQYIFMAITIPDLNSSWIKSFYKGISELTNEYNIALIGGDTNKGPLSISIQVIGTTKYNILYRSGAKLNDDIYVTGELGSARAALMIKNNKNYSKEFKHLKKYLHTPQPRIKLGMDLSRFATSCIDISDGIAKDLKNIMCESKCGANIHINQIPFNKILNKIVKRNIFYECIIGGGEDYELCFTASSKYSTRIKYLSKKHNIRITKIGNITKNNLNYYENDKLINLSLKGYDHFIN